MQTTDVRDAAQSAVTQSKSFISRQVEERTAQLGSQVGSIAGDLRRIGNQLRANPTLGMAAPYVDRGAEMVDGVAHYLQEAELDRLLGDFEAIARKQPWAIAGGALVAGFAASRFLKTSSARRYRESEDSSYAG